jgi:hypothetical protein
MEHISVMTERKKKWKDAYALVLKTLMLMSGAIIRGCPVCHPSMGLMATQQSLAKIAYIAKKGNQYGRYYLRCIQPMG